jgi:hypothetical protein
MTDEEKPAPLKSRIGFLKGKIVVPDDIKTPFAAEIEQLFYSGDLFPPESGEDEPQPPPPSDSAR